MLLSRKCSANGATMSHKPRMKFTQLKPFIVMHLLSAYTEWPPRHGVCASPGHLWVSGYPQSSVVFCAKHVPEPEGSNRKGFSPRAGSRGKAIQHRRRAITPHRMAIAPQLSSTKGCYRQEKSYGISAGGQGSKMQGLLPAPADYRCAARRRPLTESRGLVS